MTEPLSLDVELTIDGASYEVLRLRSEEPTSDFGALDCHLTDRAGGPDPAALVGKPIRVTISRHDDGQKRCFAGVVVEASWSTGRGDAESTTHVVARPRLFRLTQRADCRVFQDRTTQEIVTEVLGGAGLGAADQRWQLGGSYSKRLYTTQYRETDADFVLRLLAEEGISFTVDSSSGADVAVFFDADLGAIEGDRRIVHRPADGLTPAHDAASVESHAIGTAPGKVHVRDFDFEKPRLALDSKTEGDVPAEKALEVYVYPGRFKDPSLGDRRAAALLGSLRSRRERVGGSTSTLRLSPGHTFTLDEHPYPPLNRDYLVLTVGVEIDRTRHAARSETARFDAARPDTARADTDHYERRERVTFTAVPCGETPLRPPRRPLAASIPGAHVAVITGPPGKEIHPDGHGRVKVSFPWDRLGKKDDSSSLWVRTSQLPLGGSMLTPRVGWEASVSFTEGDPDEPFVLGRMYNARTRPPYPLPQNKTRMSIQTATTPGGGSVNEIRMEDKAGQEEMFMNASRDSATSVGNNATEAIGNNESRTIGSNAALNVTDSMAVSIGGDQTTSVGANQTLNVETFLVEQVGSHTLSIGGNRDLKAGGDHNRTVTGASTLSVSGMMVDLVAGSADVMALATMEDSVGAALVEMTASNRTVTAQGDRSEKAGAAKVVLAAGGRAVEVGGSLNHKVAGAVITSVDGTRADAASGDYQEVAGGAQLVKATTAVFEATDVLSVVMGGSTLTLTPASISIAGAKITLDGEVVETSAIVADN